MSDKFKSSYLKYLPAIFQEDPFLGQFLVPFEEVLSSFESLLSDVDRYVSPSFTGPVPSAQPDSYPEFLRWLARWVALVLDEQWDESKQRRLINEAVGLYRLRGTVQGLKRYLEIYTGVEPEIKECRWPAGMQIGVASVIGGDADDVWPRLPPTDGGNVFVKFHESLPHELTYHDYYVVETPFTALYPENPGQHTAQIAIEEVRKDYYRTDKVARVDIGEEKITITLVDGADKKHYGATISRRDALRHDTYPLRFGEDQDADDNTFMYQGNTLLIDDVEMPYRFIVDVKVPADATGDVDEQLDLRAVRSIVELEKPAHTQYYLKLTRVAETVVLPSMQIEVKTTSIGLDTIVGLDPGRKV